MKGIFNPIKKAHVLMCLFLVFAISCKEEKSASYNKKEVDNVILIQTYYTSHLEECLKKLKLLNEESQWTIKIDYYKEARREFKLLEPILAFADKGNYKTLNAPNILKVEEDDVTDIKVFPPFGFQVIEELLHEETRDVEKLEKVVKTTGNRLALVLENNKLYLKKHHILWLLRDQVARVSLTGITGFDSPVLEQSLIESSTSYKTVAFLIDTYKKEFRNQKLYIKWEEELKLTNEILEGDFNTFNRYEFIKNRSHSQLVLLKETATDWQVNFPLTLAFNNNITSFFSKETFNSNFFKDHHDKNNYKNEKIALGKQLFHDKNLSKGKVMNCATCHIKEKAFTDGLTTFTNQKRNSPTLLYAAYQQKFFYDARAGSLEGQIVGVVENKNEFHTDLSTLENVVKSDSMYQKTFKKLYGETNDRVIRNAIATYIRSLGDFNSKFDNNINERENTLTTSEINGFNVFMGKGKCATCHFPPIFNGTVPPDFKESELEAIGVPDLEKNKLDSDLGRYEIFQTKERKHFFKTPTVRNVSKTSPYMHNGVYSTLEEVVDLYNKGGGIGLGFSLENQTLPSDELNLTEEEIKDIITFMESLTDKN